MPARSQSASRPHGHTDGLFRRRVERREPLARRRSGARRVAGVCGGRAGCRSWCADARSPRTATATRLTVSGARARRCARNSGTAGRGLTLSPFPEWGAAGMGSTERLCSMRDASERAHGYRFDVGMWLAAEFGNGRNAFRGRSAMTPFLGTRSGVGGAICPSASTRRGAGRRRCRPTTRCG